MSMIDTITDFGSGAVSKLKNFHYGHHPSIIMWSNGSAAVKKEPESTSVFTGVATKLENIVSGTSGVPESFSSFKFDAMVSEDHDAQTVVTKFPVSTGFMVSDHVINQNRVLKLTAVAVNMQNSALWSASVQGLSVITGAIFNNPILPLAGSLVGGIASGFETSDRITSTYNLFNNFRTTGTKLYVSTILGPYLNCVVTGLRTKHDKTTSAMLAIEITLEELQVVTQDDLAIQVQKAMESMYDYSEFAKMATSVGIGVLGGGPLPGLGTAIPGLGAIAGGIGKVSPTQQLANLKTKLSNLPNPVSAIKGILS